MARDSYTTTIKQSLAPTMQTREFYPKQANHNSPWITLFIKICENNAALLDVQGNETAHSSAPRAPKFQTVRQSAELGLMICDSTSNRRKWVAD